MTLAEISSSTRLRSFQRQRPLVTAHLVLSVPSEDLQERTGRGGVMQVDVLGSSAPGTSGIPGIGVFLHGGATVCRVGVLLMSGKLTCCIASR